LKTLFQSAHLLFSYNVNYSIIACTVYSQSGLYAFLVSLFLFAMCVMLITAKQLPRIQWPCRWFLCHMSWSVINKNLIETEISVFVWAETCSLILWHKPSYYNEWIYDCCVMIPPQQMQFFGTWLCLRVTCILDIQVNTLRNAISIKYLYLYFHNVVYTVVEFVMFLGYCKIIQKALILAVVYSC